MSQPSSSSSFVVTFRGVRSTKFKRRSINFVSSSFLFSSVFLHAPRIFPSFVTLSFDSGTLCALTPFDIDMDVDVRQWNTGIQCNIYLWKWCDSKCVWNVGTKNGSTEWKNTTKGKKREKTQIAHLTSSTVSWKHIQHNRVENVYASWFWFIRRLREDAKNRAEK